MISAFDLVVLILSCPVACHSGQLAITLGVFKIFVVSGWFDYSILNCHNSVILLRHDRQLFPFRIVCDLAFFSVEHKSIVSYLLVVLQTTSDYQNRFVPIRSCGCQILVCGKSGRQGYKCVVYINLLVAYDTYKSVCCRDKDIGVCVSGKQCDCVVSGAEYISISFYTRRSQITNATIQIAVFVVTLTHFRTACKSVCVYFVPTVIVIPAYPCDMTDGV